MHNCKNIQYSRYSRSRLAILLLSLYLLASSGTATKVTKESDPRGAQRKSQAAKSALEEGDADRLERVDKRKIPHKSMPNDPKDLRNAKVNADILAAAVSHTAMDETTGWVPTWVIPIVSFVSACAMTFGGVVPFIPQYLIIHRTRSCEGFNTMVCCNILAANILRILFWFGHPFELPLLGQSVLMVGAMLFLMHECTERTLDTGRKIRLHNGVLAEFWKWTDYADYLQIVAAFTVASGTITWLFLNVSIYVELLGFLAVFIEAMQGVPQLMRNFRNASTKGMSLAMVGCWFSGDTFKTMYYLLREAPKQFTGCALLQVGVDIAIMSQVWIYRGQQPREILPVRP